MYILCSTWFYCGFLIINFKWAGWFLFANGLGPWKTYRLLRVPRLVMFAITGAVVVTQAALLLALFVILMLDIFDDSLYDAGLRTLFVLQLIYHSFLGLLAVASFGFWMAYAKAKKALTRGMSYRQQLHSRLNLLFTVTTILALLILFKSLANVGLAIMRTFNDFCKNTNVAVVSSFGIIVDILPLFIVVYVLSNSFSADEHDYEEDDTARKETAHLSISKVGDSDPDDLLATSNGYQTNAVVHQPLSDYDDSDLDGH